MFLLVYYNFTANNHGAYCQYDSCIGRSTVLCSSSSQQAVCIDNDTPLSSPYYPFLYTGGMTYATPTDVLCTNARAPRLISRHALTTSDVHVFWTKHKQFLESWIMCLKNYSLEYYIFKCCKFDFIGSVF